MSAVYIGLGSNTGDRSANLATARDMLCDAGILITAESPIEKTDPVDFIDQPKFLNQVIRATTELPPRELLIRLKDIERTMGRVPTFPKGPRSIDLDILLYDDLVLSEDDLQIPHHALTQRQFVMREILHLNENIIEPASGRLLREVYDEKFPHQEYQ
jgi:2-amino-4-hydroxy-6-hydroxymethyldihydropteridine diphosphokinase